MKKPKTKTKILVGLLMAVFVAGPFASGLSLAATTTLTVVTTQANAAASAIPAVTFSGGSDAVSASVPAVTFSGGADASGDGTIPEITFTSGTAADLVSIPDIIVDGGVDEVKANQTLTMGTLLADNDMVTIGNCVVTFDDGAGTGDNSSAVSDLDCADGAATVNNYTSFNPGVALTEGQIAGQLRSLENVSDDVHGVLATGGSGLDAVFTTAGTETIVGDITFSDGTTGKITNVSVTSVVGVAASSTITMLAGLAANATDHTIVIDDIGIDLGTDSQNASGVAAIIAATDFSSGTAYVSYPYTVTNPVGAQVKFTGDNPGAAANGSSMPVQDAEYTATNNNPSIAQFVITDSLADPLDNGSPYVPYDHAVTIDGIAIDLGSAAQTTAQIAVAINAAINLDGTKDYTSSVSGSTITLTENSLGAVGNGVTLPVTDGDYTTTGPVVAADTVTIVAGLPADASDHSVTIDGIIIDLGISALDSAGVAAAIRAGITGSGSYAGKDYAVSGSGADIIFTKESGGAAGNGSLTVEDAEYTAANAVIASTQIDISAALPAGSADHSVGIDGVTVELGTAAKTAAEIAAVIAAADFSGKDYAVANPSGATLSFTKDSGGAAGNVSLTLQDAGYGTMAQVVTVTPANVTAGETATVTINGTDYSYVVQVGDGAAEVVSGLKTAITSPAAATSGTDTLVLTASVPGTAFTAAGSLVDAPVAEPDPAPTIEAEDEVEYYKLSGYVKKQGTLVPIVGATVKLYTKSGKKKDSVKTDKRGRYSFKKLKEGKTYVVRVFAAGYVNPENPARKNAVKITLKKIKKRTHKNVYLSQ